MDQFIFTEKTLLKMLNEAFVAGYESPLELSNQEIARIYNKHVKKAKLTSCGDKPKKLKPLHILTDEEEQDIVNWMTDGKELTPILESEILGFHP